MQTAETSGGPHSPPRLPGYSVPRRLALDQEPGTGWSLPTRHSCRWDTAVVSFPRPVGNISGRQEKVTHAAFARTTPGEVPRMALRTLIPQALLTLIQQMPPQHEWHTLKRYPRQFIRGQGSLRRVHPPFPLGKSIRKQASEPCPLAFRPRGASRGQQTTSETHTSGSACVVKGKLLNRSVPQFPCKNGHRPGTCRTGCL